MSRTLPGQQTLLDASIRPEKCVLATSQNQEPSRLALKALSPVADDEVHGVPSHTGVLSGRPSPDNQCQNEPTLRSVLVPVLPKVGYRGPAQPELSMVEVMYGLNSESLPLSTALTASSSSVTASKRAFSLLLMIYLGR